MEKHKGFTPAFSRLRCLAVERLRSKNIPAVSSVSYEESQRLIHELQVYQIELELQNEELLQVRQEAEAIHSQFKDIYELAPVGYLNLDSGGIIRAVNIFGAKCLGAELPLLVSRSLDLFISGETRPIFHDFLDKVFASKAKETCEVVLLKESHPPISVRMEALVSESGKECRAVIIDITKRKQAETYGDMGREILQVLNETIDLPDSIQCVLAILKTRTGFDAVGIRLQNGDDFPYFAQKGLPKDFLLTENTLIERGKDGGVCRDKDGNVRLECTCGLVISGKTDSANPLFTQGGSFWINDSLPLLDILPSKDPRLHLRNECIRKGYATMALVPIRNKDKIVGLIQVNDRSKGRLTLELVELLEGIASHIGAALMRKLAEEEKIKLECQLLHAQKMESVGRLAGGVAHDFNNMLCAIIGHANLALIDLDPSQPLFSHLEEILKAGERSADLTRQLLAFARKQTVTPKVLNLNKTVADILKMLQRIIGEDITLNWQSEASLWSVKVDPSQIDQILANLCVNARDSITDVGVVTIETGNSVIDEGYCALNAGIVPGEYVRLAVSDNGCGMDKETLAHIFEPFFTTKDVGMGTGLGLATVYGAVKQNNGFINVYSEPCFGTTFTIYLPRYLGNADQTGTRVAAGLALRGLETILLVEDEPTILNITQMILSKQGYTVLAANSPNEAIRLAREHAGEISLLMTDVIMPEMNGRDLAKNLLSNYPHLKRLFMSGYTADVIAHHGVLDEGVHFIQKPFSMPDLAAKVREVLDSK